MTTRRWIGRLVARKPRPIRKVLARRRPPVGVRE
jgi:hypothetical protein